MLRDRPGGGEATGGGVAPRSGSDRGARHEARFSDWLRARSGPTWAAATHHRFMQELSSGRLDEAVFKRYLVHEYSFVKTSAAVLGYAIAYAPSMDAKARLVDAARALTTEQRGYFERAFTALGVPASEREPRVLHSSVLAFRDTVLGAAAHGGYEETLATMLAAEWMYLTWSKRAAGRLPPHPLYKEWISIHVSPAFEAHVSWMRGELDALGPLIPAYHQAQVAYVFRRTLELEVGFHDAAYPRGGAAR